MKIKDAFKLIFTGLSFAASTCAALDITVTNAPYNAIPDDGSGDDAAFKNALTNIVANGGGTLTVPAGKYIFSSRQTIDLKDKTVAIVGCGKGVTQLHCTNSTGIWWFSNTLNSNQLSICDLTFVAAAPASAGTAIQINNPSLCSGTNVCSLYMSQVGFDVTGRGTNYFARHIYTTYLKNPVFADVFVTTFGMQGSSESGFRINYGDGAYFENCYSKGIGLGWTLTNYKGDVIFNRCNAVGANIGFDISGIATNTCFVDLLGVHSNTSTNNVRLANADRVRIENLASYVADIQTPFTDFALNNCTNVTISGCVFHQPYDPNRTLIDLQGSTRDVLIKQNIFNARGTRVNGGTEVTLLENIDPPQHDW